MSLEESEEAGAGEGLQGTNPAETLSGCYQVLEAFLLCHGEEWKDAQKPSRRAKKVGVFWALQEGTSPGAMLEGDLAVEP